MGAGAGYTISVKDCEVTNLNESAIRIVELGSWDNGLVRGGSAAVECDVKINGSIDAHSYYYGCDYIEDVDMSVLYADVNLGFGNGYNKEILTPEAVIKYTEQFGVVDIEELYDELISVVRVGDISKSYIVDVLNHDLSNLVGEGYFGGGWVHSTFNGEFELTKIDDHDGYNDIYSAIIKIDNNIVTAFIDTAVTGDNVQYATFDGDGIIDTFATEEEAIDALKDYIRDDLVNYDDISDFDFSQYTVESEYYYLTDGEGNYGGSEWGGVVWTADESDFIE